MKPSSLLIIIIIVCLQISCSGDDSGDSLKGKNFHLTAVRLSQPVDLNQDGVASLDMTDEIACMGDETLYFGPNGNSVTKTGGFVGIIISSTFPPTTNEADYYECTGPDLFSHITYKMTNFNTVVLTFNPSTHPAYTVTYELRDGNKLIKTAVEQYPVSYDEITHKWHNAPLEVTREFTAYSN